MAAEHDMNIQHLLAEALNNLFAKYGEPEIVPVAEKTSRRRREGDFHRS